MFLAYLSSKAQFLFWELCVHAVRADNFVTKKEKIMIDDYCREMKMDFPEDYLTALDIEEAIAEEVSKNKKSLLSDFFPPEEIEKRIRERNRPFHYNKMDSQDINMMKKNADMFLTPHYYEKPSFESIKQMLDDLSNVEKIIIYFNILQLVYKDNSYDEREEIFLNMLIDALALPSEIISEINDMVKRYVSVYQDVSQLLIKNC